MREKTFFATKKRSPRIDLLKNQNKNASLNYFRTVLVDLIYDLEDLINRV